ncbi:MAG: DUF3703 domain-containing protein [Pseudomonadota bacterium]
MNPATFTKDQRQATYSQLMQGFASSQQQDTETRWAWLVAAHVVGQHEFPLHWRNHVAMLRFALELKDYSEAAGQLLRLALVPLGHLMGKLPAGNIGRATVSAFKPMVLEQALRRLILEAQASRVQQKTKI